MIFFQLVIAICAVYLFLLFLAQPFLFIFRTMSRLLYPPDGPFTANERPDDVDPLPLEDLSQLAYAMLLGKDRFGRMIYKGFHDDGGYRFYHYDSGLQVVRDLHAMSEEEIMHYPRTRTPSPA